MVKFVARDACGLQRVLQIDCYKMPQHHSHQIIPAKARRNKSMANTCHSGKAMLTEMFDRLVKTIGLKLKTSRPR